jgi:acetyl esterase/lipase
MYRNSPMYRRKTKQTATASTRIDRGLLGIVCFALCMLFLTASASNCQEPEATAEVAEITTQETAATKTPQAEEVSETRIPIQVERHLVFREFDDGTELKADLFRPAAQAPQDGYPLVLMIHGGGWSTGDKWNLSDHGRELAQAGFVAVSVNYRLAPRFKIGKQLEDCTAAANWAVNQAKTWGADPDRFGLWGYSAGAHLASLVALHASRVKPGKNVQQETLDNEGPRPAVRAVVAGGIPADFSFVPEKSPFLAPVFGGSRYKLPEVYEQFTPLAQVHDKAPPFFLFHGESDFLVPFKLSLRMDNALKDAGVSSKHMKIKNKGHMLTFLDQSARRAAIEFLKAHLTQ